MPAPTYKTKIGKLRKRCRLRQDEFGELVGRSVFTIQSLESGKHELGEELAIRVAEETGVSIDWLMAKNDDSPPVEAIPPRNEYTRTSYENYRYKLENNMSTLQPAHLPGIVGAQLEGVIASALKKKRGRSALYRISKFISELRDEFGTDENAEEALKEIVLSSWDLGNLFDPEMEIYERARKAMDKTVPPDATPKRHSDGVLPAKGPGVYPFLVEARKIGLASLSLRPLRGKRQPWKRK